MDISAIEPSGSSPSPKKKEQVRRVNGNLIQHHNIHLKEEVIEKEGLELDDDVWSFSPEEDDILRENWAKFQKFNRFKGTIFELIGFGEDGISRATLKHNLNKLTWPSLCNGLPHRQAKVIRLRLSFILHPLYDENKDYEPFDDEIKKQLSQYRPITEIAETLKVPPRYIKTLATERVPSKELNKLSPEVQIPMLKLLYESITENPKPTFKVKNFNFKKFHEKCRARNFPESSYRDLKHVFYYKFCQAEKCVFQFLDPQPAFDKKWIFFYESAVRYALERKSHGFQVKPSIVFTVVFEYYNKNEIWNPPPELQHFAEEIDLEKARKRVISVTERRQRMQLTCPTPKLKIVSKRIKKEDIDDNEKVLVPKRRRAHFTEEDEDDVVDISSIHGDSTIHSIAGDSTVDFDNADDSAILRLDESTISNLNSESTQKEKKSFVIDESRDIWLQLMS